MLNKQAFLFLVLIAVNFKSIGILYIYPTASDQNSIFYIYQKSLADLELWRLFLSDNKSQTNHLEKCLYWRFIPAGFALLPSKKSFSFIDSGRLWIKDFIKRSPNAVNFDQPVFNINEVRWITDQICYFSAKQNQDFVIFIGDLCKQNLKILHDAPGSECVSPKILDSQLWYIERHKQDRSCSIIGLDLIQDFKINCDRIDTRVTIDCGYQQVIYLEMCNSELGFYVEHMPYISDNLQEIVLVCYKIELVNQAWVSTRLFKYSVPKKYLFSQARACESIMPFLPRAKKTRLYFSDIKQNQVGKYYSELFEFDLINLKNIALLKSDPDFVFFAPLKKNHKIFYGQILNDCENIDFQDIQVKQLIV